IHDYTGQPSSVAGTPAPPFPVFLWPNRPFVSQYELLNVPAFSSAWMLAYHWLFDPTPTTGCKHYVPTTKLTYPRGLTTPTFDPFPEQDLAYRHLLPFFAVSTPYGNVAPQLYRLFDYVHVPSRFAGTETYLNPNIFQGSNTTNHPPFNKISGYREP